MKRDQLTTGVCPVCFRETSIELFPAAFRTPQELDLPAQTPLDDEASCYEHPGRKAAGLCWRCGRFVCKLCEVELGTQTWCPVCLLDQHSEAAESLVRNRTLFDSIALALATLPMLVFLYPSLLTWPIVMYLGIRHWKTPSSLVPRNKWRMVLALSVASVQMLLLLLLIGGVIWTLYLRQTGLRVARP